MKNKQDRFILLKEYETAAENTLFTQMTVAAIRDCSLATIERDRWAGTGIPFVKIGHHVRYRKRDIEDWLARHAPVSSTIQAQLQAQQLEDGIYEK